MRSAPCQWEGCEERATVRFAVRGHARQRECVSLLCFDHHVEAARHIDGEATFLEEDAPLTLRSAS